MYRRQRFTKSATCLGQCSAHCATPKDIYTFIVGFALGWRYKIVRSASQCMHACKKNISAILDIFILFLRKFPKICPAGIFSDI